MNFASLDLSKELYELSGWDDTGAWHKTTHWKEVTYGKDITPPSRRICPAYDLGYLMRKLQLEHHTTFLDYGDWSSGRFPESYWWKANLDGDIIAVADTPEDAACKLCIELFKQGLLMEGVR